MRGDKPQEIVDIALGLCGEGTPRLTSPIMEEGMFSTVSTDIGFVDEVACTTDASHMHTIPWKVYSDSSSAPYYQPIMAVEPPAIDVDSLVSQIMEEMYGASGKAIIQCQYCGQWAARMTACRKCGGAVE